MSKCHAGGSTGSTGCSLSQLCHCRVPAACILPLESAWPAPRALMVGLCDP